MVLGGSVQSCGLGCSLIELLVQKLWLCYNRLMAALSPLPALADCFRVTKFGALYRN